MRLVHPERPASPVLVLLVMACIVIVAGIAASSHASANADRASGPECRIELSAGGSGGWGSARALGCVADPGHPPSAVVIVQEAEDLDRDHAFDVYEDSNRNGRLDAGEDSDGDGRLTPPGGCEGLLREDVDCDGRADRINEDLNGDGRWDARTEDLDGDRYFDAIDEDFNHNGFLDPGEDTNGNGRLDDGTFVDPVTGERTRIYEVYIEDRNCNQEIDDRPFPGPKDEISTGPPFCQIPEPPDYPYGHFHPSRGAVTVLHLQWDGTVYTPAANDAGSERGTQ